MSSRNVDPDAIPSRNRVAEFSSDLSRALVGKTIAGLVVGNIEVYADGEVNPGKFLDQTSPAGPRGRPRELLR